MIGTYFQSVKFSFFLFFFFFKILFVYSQEAHRERQRRRQREKQAPRRELNMGLDPGSPGSHSGLQAALNCCATRAAPAVLVSYSTVSGDHFSPTQHVNSSGTMVPSYCPFLLGLCSGWTLRGFPLRKVTLPEQPSWSLGTQQLPWPQRGLTQLLQHRNHKA